MRRMLFATVLLACTAMGQDAPDGSSSTKTLTVKQAQTLVKAAALSEESAAAVAQRKVLFLNGLTSLDDKAAEALARQNGALHLKGLLTLSVKTARSLGQHEGNLDLDGVTTLSDEAASALAQHRGRVILDSLTNLSDKAAKALRANPQIRLP